MYGITTAVSKSLKCYYSSGIKTDVVRRHNSRSNWTSTNILKSSMISITWSLLLYISHYVYLFLTQKAYFSYSSQCRKLKISMSDGYTIPHTISYFMFLKSKHEGPYSTFKWPKALLTTVPWRKKPTPPTILNVENSKLACRMVVRFLTQ